jgi:hypothetical protein
MEDRRITTYFRLTDQEKNRCISVRNAVDYFWQSKALPFVVEYTNTYSRLSNSLPFIVKLTYTTVYELVD